MPFGCVSTQQIDDLPACRLPQKRLLFAFVDGRERGESIGQGRPRLRSHSKGEDVRSLAEHGVQIPFCEDACAAAPLVGTVVTCWLKSTQAGRM